MKKLQLKDNFAADRDDFAADRAEESAKARKKKGSTLTKGAEPVTPFEVIADVAERTEAGAKLQKTLAEAAYKPPAQTDAFREAMPIDSAGRKLLQEIEKIERLEEDKQAIMADQAEIMGELKSEGYDMAAVRDLIRLRKLDDYSERLQMVKLYVERVGMVWPS